MNDSPTDRPALAADGRIDTHGHLLPGVDDGCRDAGESIACARRLVALGYTHAFCTSHASSLDAACGGRATPGWVRAAVGAVQGALDGAGVALRLLPGAEYSIAAGRRPPSGELLTYGMAGRFVLFDFWDHAVPREVVRFAESVVRRGMVPVLGHPERSPAVQRDPGVLDDLADIGVRFQGNLAPLTEPRDAVRHTAERLLNAGRYWVLGSDAHRPDTFAWRESGLARAVELVGTAEVDRLTRVNPRELLATV